MESSIRAAKKANQLPKISEPMRQKQSNKKRKVDKKGPKKRVGAGGFDNDGGRASREGARAGRSDGVGLGGKKGGKGKFGKGRK